MLRLTGFAIVATLLAQAPSQRPPCDPENGGLTLPAGFCATLFADSVAGARHLDVTPTGEVIVGLRSTRVSGQSRPGGLMILRDSDGDGHADRRERVGEFNGTEVRVVGNQVYAGTTTEVLRYAWNAGAMSVAGPDTIVAGLPGDRGHPFKTFVVHRGGLYVNHGSPSNSCQQRDRTARSPGFDPCPELETRAGIWRFDANRTGQTLQDGERFATGIRNSIAMAVEPRTGDLYVMQHGRDGLQDWGFSPEKGAETPAEEMFRVTRGADYGWPYCYFDPELRRKVLAPEYGGDGTTVGRCADKAGNVGFFPGHWAPNGLLFYTGRSLPARYRDGAFIVFHGSWNRAPLPQQGFKVVFQPMTEGRASGPFEVFVDGFIDADGKPTALGGRPTGIAQGPAGELYVSDDSRGRIWKITYTGT